MRVLVVEDDPFFATRLAEILDDYGLQTLVVGTAEAALAVNFSDYDAAIIDLVLPNDPSVSGLTVEECRGGYRAGLAVARRLLKNKNDIKIVLMSGDVWPTEAEEWARERGIPSVRKFEKSAVIAGLHRAGIIVGRPAPRAFIVHGHDEAVLLQLKNYIQNTLRWPEPLILREQANSGRTMIEKFEEFITRVDCVFILLTPDDSVRGATRIHDKRRSRPNVIFELGFFYRHFGRASGRVIVLYKGETELPSDILGIAWIDISKGIDAAGEQIRREVALFS